MENVISSKSKLWSVRCSLSTPGVDHKEIERGQKTQNGWKALRFESRAEDYFPCSPDFELYLCRGKR